MHEGASRRGGAGQGRGPGALLRALAGLGLLIAVGCGAAESSDEGSNGGGSLPGTGVPGEWIGLGGQTGSLMPSACGLAPVARLQGVPSSEGFVVYTTECASAAELALVDADGNAVPVQTQMLGADAVLVTPPAGLEPGSYTLINQPAPVDEDRDGGFDDDADAGPDGPASPGVGAVPAGGETLMVLAPSSAPTRLGDLMQPNACSADLELAIDPSVVPHLPSLALDLRVGDGPPQRIVPFGTALLSFMGTVHIAVPVQQLPEGGSATIVVEGVLAGEPVAIAPAMLTITCPGSVMASAPGSGWSDGSDDSGCSVSHTRSSRPRVRYAGATDLTTAAAAYRTRGLDDRRRR